jgi:calmodulin
MTIKQKKNEGGEEEIKESFKIFDKNGTGVISVEELRHILTTIGEKLTEEEFSEMMKEAEIDQNKNINCADFVKMLLAK